MVMRLIEWLWRFLPDRCVITGCSRQGVRGNENIVGYNQIDKPIYVCDYCHAKRLP